MHIVAINNRPGKVLPCDSARFQMAWRVSSPFLHRRVGFASSPLPANLVCMLRVFFSGAGCPLSVSQPWNDTNQCRHLVPGSSMYICSRTSQGIVKGNPENLVKLTCLRCIWNSFLWSSGWLRFLVASGRLNDLASASMS